MQCPVLKAVLLAALIISTPSSAREFTDEDRLLCDAKMTVAEYAYRNRNLMPKDHVFKALDQTWKERWSSLSNATYVDLRRIVNEAYRMNSGKHRHDACVKGQESVCTALIEKHMKEECYDALRKGF